MNRVHVNQFLTNFEAQIELGSSFAARILGIAYPTYAAYRNSSRELPQYHVNQIHLISLLSIEARKVYIEGRLDATQ